MFERHHSAVLGLKLKVKVCPSVSLQMWNVVRFLQVYVPGRFFRSECRNPHVTFAAG